MPERRRLMSRRTFKIIQYQVSDMMHFDGFAKVDRGVLAPNDFDIPQSHTGCVFYIYTCGGVFRQCLIRAGAAGETPAGPFRPFINLDAYVFQQDFFDPVWGPSLDVNAIFSPRQYIDKANVPCPPDASLVVPGDRGDNDRVAAAPPFLMKYARLYHHVREEHIFDIAGFAQPDCQ